MPDNLPNPWSIANARLADAPDGTKLRRSLNADGTRRMKDGLPVSEEYDTFDSFIKLHGTPYMLQEKIANGGNARAKYIAREGSAERDVAKITPHPFLPMEISINRACGYTQGAVTRTDEAKHYLPMPYLGETLYTLLREDRLSDLECVHLSIRLCILASYLHAGRVKGMIPLAHMDIKLTNITRHNGRLYFIDFGASVEQPTSILTHSTGTHLFRPPLNEVMSGEEYDMIALRRALFLPEQVMGADGRMTYTQKSLLWHGVFAGTPLEKWLDTSESACPDIAAFRKRHVTAVVLSAMLIATFYRLDLDIDTLPYNPWLCLLLINLYESEYTPEAMQSTLASPEAFLRSRLDANIVATMSLDDLKALYLFDQLRIPLTESVINHRGVLFKVAHLPGFLPHLGRLTCVDPALLRLLVNTTGRNSAILAEKVRILLDTIPITEHRWLNTRLKSILSKETALKDVTHTREQALYIILRKQLSLDAAQLDASPKLATLLVRLNAANIVTHHAEINQYRRLSNFLVSGLIPINLLAGIRHTLHWQDAQKRAQRLADMNACPVAWNILFSKEAAIPDGPIPLPLLRTIHYCNVPSFHYDLYATRLLRFPLQYAEALADATRFLRIRSPDILERWVEQIVSETAPEAGLEYLRCARLLGLMNTPSYQFVQVFEILKNAPSVPVLKLYRILLHKNLLCPPFIDMMRRLPEPDSSDLEDCLISALNLGVQSPALYATFLQSPPQRAQFASLFRSIEALKTNAPAQCQPQIKRFLLRTRLCLSTRGFLNQINVSAIMREFFGDIEAVCRNIPTDSHEALRNTVTGLLATTRALREHFPQPPEGFLGSSRKRATRTEKEPPRQEDAGRPRLR